MIKPNELRIGNLVEEPKGFTHKVENISIDSNRERFGIPITEEWLLKFGFEKIGNTIFKKESFEFNLYVDSTGTLVTYGDSSIIYIYDIHQLQNLYFSLTQTELELTIKE